MSPTHPGLKPLRLVEKLIAAKLISPLPPPVPKALDFKKARPSVQVTKTSLSTAPRVSSAQRLSTAKVPRPSHAGQRMVVPKRAPFVVPLNYSSPRVARASPRPAAQRPSLPRPIRSSKPEYPKPVSRTPKPPVASAQVAVKVGIPKPAAPRSRIPVFVGHPSAEVFTPTPTPQLSSSRIPRLVYATSPSPSPNSTCSRTGSVISFTHHTPCPSSVLVMNARQMAPRVIALNTARVPTMTESNSDSRTSKAELVDETEKAEVCDIDGSSPTLVINKACVVSQPLTQNAGMVLPVTASDDSAVLLIDSQQAEQAANSSQQEPRRGVMGALVEGLKFRLGRKKLAPAGPLGSPSPTKGAFVVINGSNSRRQDKENDVTVSELQQAFARRRSAVSAFLSTDVKPTLPIPSQDRRPLASRSVNQQRPPVPVGTPAAQTSSMSQTSPALDTDALPSNDSNNNLPGVDYVTELVTTAFGTRRVRRLVVPPILEGSVPSRNPQIRMELDRLRAQQKVGGGGGSIVGAAVLALGGGVATAQ
ncbi:hypothetical protein C8R44DRAFT_863896 [Mycena epipterygia]|nr:hypothetical protein C8R44DRAFT_863896 [Mycena epipterygia]